MTAGAGPRDPRAWLPALCWGLAGAAASFGLAPLEPNLLEEGFALHVAQRLAAGEHLYRDVVFYSGPLPFEFLGLLFRVFGDDIGVARGAVATLHGLATGAVFATARRAGAGAWSHGAAAALVASAALLFPLYSIYFHTTFAVHLALVAVWLASRAPASAAAAVATGLLAAGVALSKQSIGALLAPGLLAVVVAGTPRDEAVRRGLAVVAGGCIAALATLVFYGVREDLEPLVRCVAILPLTLEESFAAPYVNFWPIGRISEALAPNQIFYLPKLYHLFAPVFSWPPRWVVATTQLLFAMPLLVLLATAIHRVQRGTMPVAAWSLAVGLVALLSNVFPRADWGHLAAVLPIATAHGLVLVGRAFGGRGRRASIAAWAVTIGLLGSGVATGANLYAISSEPMLGPRVPLRPVGGEAETIAPAVRYLLEHTSPGDAIFVARAEPLIYFATDTRNPTPFEGVVPGMREEQQERILAGLGEARYVVMSDVDQSFMTYYADELPRVHAYLERHLRLPRDWRGDLSPVQVYERGGSRGPTVLDLVEDWPGGEPWIRTETGEEQAPEQALPRLSTRHNRRPMALRLGPGGGGIDLEVDLPEQAVFEADLGIRAVNSNWGLIEQPRFLNFSVSVDVGDGVLRPVLSEPHSGLVGRRWTPVAADLSAYGGRRVTLRLEAVPRHPLQGRDVTWWASPRITVSGAGGQGP